MKNKDQEIPNGRKRSLRGSGCVFRPVGRHFWYLKYVKDGKVFTLSSKTSDKSMAIKMLERITGRRYAPLEIKLNGFIYILQWKNSYKIGAASNHRLRIGSIKSSCPVKIKSIFVGETQNVLETERDLHLSLEVYRYNGEWFRLDEVGLAVLKTKLDALTKDGQLKVLYNRIANTRLTSTYGTYC